MNDRENEDFQFRSIKKSDQLSIKCLQERREEYFKSLNTWAIQYQTWYSMSLSFYIAYHVDQQTRYLLANQPALNQNAANQPGSTISQNRLQAGIDYRIPPLWKRFAAEFVDFFILFFLKIAITFLAVDVFHWINLDKYDIDSLQANGKLNFETAFEMTAEIIILEIIHRALVCVYETYWLSNGYGRPGGSTPGKALVGLRVVYCTRITLVERFPDMVCHVEPATDLGFCRSLYRSFIKNLVLALMFPVCFGLFIFDFNRTCYDLMCNTVVVEEEIVQVHH